MTLIVPDPADVPNADVIAGLREAADFLEKHPELPRMRATIGAYPWGRESRSALTALAVALGDRAVEKVSGNCVWIVGNFGERVRVTADASLSDLGAISPAYAPVYDPILSDRGHA